ncbi:MAG: NAD(P)-binding protein [Actinomycetia bacterium]|nr:NAD(P)-binding protein [Actinomycetes bacterium]
MRLAIVGSGIAGLGCAHVLGPHHEVTLFEADDRLGGHANTVTVDDPEVGPIPVDTGFIVHNDRNYPNLTRLFEELSISVQDTDMSFGVVDRGFGSEGRLFTYRATNLRTLFADRRNLVRPELWRMLGDIARFHRAANRLLDSHEFDPSTVDTHRSLGDFLAEGRYSSVFVNGYLLPMGASVWSADPNSFDAFPAVSLFRFLRNHGLLSVGNRPQWRTIVGGSRVYVDAVAANFKGTIRTGTPIKGIARDDHGATVRTSAGSEHFDRIILACHSDQALALLDDATVAEKEVLGAVSYQPNTATLHTDTSLLSPKRAAWAAWNYECPPSESDSDGVATLTYDMTTLQNLPGSRRYLVSLNSDDRIDPNSVLASFSYAHPVFDGPAIRAQGRFEEVDGVRSTHFCGAYWGYGFHEDGISSALRVCRRLGVDW